MGKHPVDVEERVVAVWSSWAFTPNLDWLPWVEHTTILFKFLFFVVVLLLVLEPNPYTASATEECAGRTRGGIPQRHQRKESTWDVKLLGLFVNGEQKQLRCTEQTVTEKQICSTFFSHHYSWNHEKVFSCFDPGMRIVAWDPSICLSSPPESAGSSQESCWGGFKPRPRGSCLVLWADSNFRLQGAGWCQKHCSINQYW